MRTLWLAPWRRAPLLLIRHPSVVAAVLGAVVVVSAAAASVPLFLSSVGSASVGLQTAEFCGPTDGVQIEGTVARAGVNQQETELAGKERSAWKAAGVDPSDFQPVVDTVLAGTHSAIAAGRAGATAEPIQLVARTGAVSHIDVLSSDHGPGAAAGLWIPDTYATIMGVKAGSVLLVDGRVPVTVAGIYRDLEGQVVPPYWCSLQNVIGGPDLSAPPPSMGLLSQASLERLDSALGVGPVQLWVESSPRSGPLSIDQARRVIDSYSDLATGEVGYPAFRNAGAPPWTLEPSQLTFVTDHAAALQSSIVSPVSAVGYGGLAVAMLLVAAAGSFWVDRRRVEIGLLASRGVGPAAIAAKAGLEALPVAALGAVAGWLAAWEGIRLVGPAEVLDTGSLPLALGRAAGAAALALALLGAMAGLRSWRQTERPIGVGRSRMALIPWEVLLIAGAVGVLVGADHSSQVTPAAGAVPRVRGLFLLFPLLFVPGVTLLVARALLGGLALLHPPVSAVARFLAWRRVRAGGLAAALLMVATALSVGTAVYAESLTASLRATLDAKAETFVGADVATTVVPPVKLPASIAGHSTVVENYTFSYQTTVDGEAVGVIGIDPSTFTRGAAGAAFPPGTDAGALMRRLAAASTRSGSGSDLAAVVAGGVPAGRLNLTTAAGTQSVPLDIVASLASAPGQNGTRPVVLVDAEDGALRGLSPETEVWTSGADAAVALEQLQAEGDTVVFSVVATEVLDLSDFAAVGWTFSYLETLGLVTGLITAGGLLLYLESRQRHRNVSYLMARMMGLTRRRHLAALFAEVMPLLGVGFSSGALSAGFAVYLVHTDADPLPFDPPKPLLELPLGAAVVAAVATLLVGVVACINAQRNADRARPSSLIRDQE